MYHCLASEHREFLKRLLIGRGRMSNVDHSEISKFEALASRWWDTESEFNHCMTLTLYVPTILIAKCILLARKYWTLVVAAVCFLKPWHYAEPMSLVLT